MHMAALCLNKRPSHLESYFILSIQLAPKPGICSFVPPTSNSRPFHSPKLSHSPHLPLFLAIDDFFRVFIYLGHSLDG